MAEEKTKIKRKRTKHGCWDENVRRNFREAVDRMGSKANFSRYFKMNRAIISEAYNGNTPISQRLQDAAQKVLEMKMYSPEQLLNKMVTHPKITGQCKIVFVGSDIVVVKINGGNELVVNKDERFKPITVRSINNYAES
ncbi:MAG: hypothetical protein COX62_04585 [Deltaproteobacteria bacterium CG_4_10_14_0_2_um_filter_43_8]|nr:MAG: hypothetical protein COV43_04550 [Deltaproteobacteria bacterium CG11_big_fil_rev_8_21_14_0_20_42_23]PJA20522.1 MAG: hypothetical protein COX62_04585 [Deltaproteobacteria bacterium CG_4_10_14_0_2_um_filter_43_8]PJC65045.1 MAG: hypothetical protein CO021_00940 [Deltaproteobacteria bacterium CG_4_9_14_0_2_um_filter_42_21]